MATRNGTDIVESTVEIKPDGFGSWNVVSVVTTTEYTGASRAFATFLAEQLREHGTTYPRPNELLKGGE